MVGDRRRVSGSGCWRKWHVTGDRWLMTIFNDLAHWVFGSLWTSLLCIMGKLAGGWSVAVAVGVSDRWHATRGTWHVHLTHDIRHVTADTRHLNHDILLFAFLFLSVPFGIGATIRTCQKIQSLPYAASFCLIFEMFGIGVTFRTRQNIQCLPTFVSPLLKKGHMIVLDWNNRILSYTKTYEKKGFPIKIAWKYYSILSSCGF